MLKKMKKAVTFEIEILKPEMFSNGCKVTLALR